MYHLLSITSAFTVHDAGCNHSVYQFDLNSVLLISSKRCQSSFIEGYDPELPVLKSAVLYVFIEPVLHVVEAIPPDGYPCRRQLFVTRAVVEQ